MPAGTERVAMPPRGSSLFLSKGCTACHAGPDSKAYVNAGPKLADLARRFPGREGFEYVRQSILSPQAVVVPGWGIGGGPRVMPKLEVTRAEAEAIARYLVAQRR